MHKEALVEDVRLCRKACRRGSG